MDFMSNIAFSNIIYVAAMIAAFNILLFRLKVKIDSIVYANIFLMFITIIEPAPSDILFISLLIFALKDKIISNDKLEKQKISLCLFSGYILISILSAFNMLNIKVGVIFFAITLYLIFYCLVIYFFSSEDNYRIIQLAYIFGTTISAILGILGYMGVFSEYLSYDLFRTKALFKDPNVFGPSFIPSILILIGDIKLRNIIKKPIRGGILDKTMFTEFIKNGTFILVGLIILNSLGLLLSFSRAAFISFIVSMFVLFILNIKKVNIKKLIKAGIVILSVALVVWFGLLSNEWKDFFIGRIGFHGYDFGRLEAQKTGVSMAFDHYIGYGPGQYESAVEREMGVGFSAHSLYTRVLLENGVLGFLILSIIILITLFKLYKINKNEKGNETIRSSVMISIVIGLMVNSLAVDTLHWRHLWLFLGISLSLSSKYLCNVKFSSFLKLFYKNKNDCIDNEIKIKEIDDIEELERLRPAWNKILGNDNRCSPFTELDFIVSWWSFFKDKNRLFILQILENEKTIGFCPLMITKIGFYNIVRFIGFPQANFMDFIIDDEYKKRTIEAIVDYLKSKKMFFYLSGIPENSKNIELFLEYLKKKNKSYFVRDIEELFIKIDGQDFDEYYNNRFKSHERKEMKRRENKLKELGSFIYGYLDKDRIDEIFDIHERRWKKKLDGSRFSDKGVKEFYKYLALKDDLSFKTCVNTINLNNRIIAFKYGYECKNKYVSHRICHDDYFSLYGPGKLMTKERVMECFYRGMDEYNFGTGYSSYKAEWTDGRVRIKNIYFAGSGFITKLIYLKHCLLERVKCLLKRADLIVVFKDKVLGKIIYYLSLESLENLYKKIDIKIKELGIFGIAKSFVKRIGEWIFLKEKYTVYYKDLDIERGDIKLNCDCIIDEFNIDDLDELSEFTRRNPEEIIGRLYRNHKCFTAKHNEKIVYCAWADFSNIEVEGIGYKASLDGKAAYIYDGFTELKYRNKGISKDGINHIIGYLKDNDFNRCYIAVKDENAPSIKSIKKAGFVPEYGLSGFKLFKHKRNTINPCKGEFKNEKDIIL